MHVPGCKMAIAHHDIMMHSKKHDRYVRSVALSCAASCQMFPNLVRDLQAADAVKHVTSVFSFA